MPKEAPSTNDEWAVTSETSALETAVVYESESSTKCGHALPLAPLVDHLEKKTTCPVCQATIEVICDGTINAKSELASNNSNKNNDEVVTFKYRKHLFRLSVMKAPPDKLPFPFSLWFWMWHQFLTFSGENCAFTAQERIAEVLRMDLYGGMKVSKVLYN